MNRAQQLGEEKISKLLLTFSIPAIIGMLVNALYTVVDRIFIGNASDIGKDGIAGITFSMPIMIFMMALGMLIGIGGAALAAIRLGERKHEEAERILGNSISSIVILTVFFVTLSLIFLQPILKLFGTSQAILPFATDFLRIILLGSVFSSLTMCLNSFIRVDGQPKIAMLTMIIGAVVNVILNPLFIFVFHWGIGGAAFATVIAQFISMSWTLKYFMSAKSHLKIRIKYMTVEFPLVVRIMSIGLPSFLMQVANTFVNILLNIRLSQLGGDISISAIGIISSLQMLLIMPILGINQGVQPIIGFNFGAKRLDRVREALKLAVLSATGISVFGFIIIQAFPRFWITLFNQNPELVHFGVNALRAMLLMLPIIGFQIICSSYFQAIGKTHLATFLTLTRQVIILIPAIFILSSLFGIMGVVFAVPLADFVAAILTAIFITFEIKLHLNPTQDEQKNGRIVA